MSLALAQVLAIGASATLTAASPTLAWAAPLVMAPVAALSAAGDITGVVYNDFNDDGYRNLVFSPDFPAIDIGVAGIPVAAYSAAGFVISTTTDAGGFYTLTTGLPAGTPVRVEFTGFKELNYESSINGPNNRSSVRFVTTAATPVENIDFGVLNTLDFCQNNPKIAVNRFIFSDNQNGPFRNQPTCYTLPYNAQGVSDPELITHTLAFQTGAVYGMAYQKSTRSLFLSAYLKRGTSFGPGIAGNPISDGTGTIYKLDLATNNVLPFIDLDAVLGQDVTGADPHPLSDFDPFDGDKSFDEFAYSLPGKMSLGDIDVDENDRTLWAVNLSDRRLYKLPISTTAIAPAASQITSYTIPSPGCISGEGRPFGIKPHNGKIYVGGVCTSEQITSTAGITYFAGITQVNGLPVDLRAYVYAFDVATGSWGAAPVLEFPLDYKRACADIFPDYAASCRAGKQGSVADWRPWQDSFQGLIDDNFPAGYALANIGGVTDTFTAYPQPMLADIEILTNGDMVVGLRDRFSDQIGYLDPGPQEQKPFGADVIAVAAGDVLRASPNGAGGWTIESNATSVPPGRFGPSFGQGTAQGPGGGEFYLGDTNGPLSHDESTYGSLAQMPGAPEIANGAADPINAFSAGLFWMSHDDGLQNRAFEIYNNLVPGSFAKANGLGDLEILCDGAPIEIGNRVWVDVDFDGIQDADEPPIAGIELTLSDDTGPLGIATTDANGNYYFSNAITPTFPLTKEIEVPSLARFSPTSATAIHASSLYSLPIAYNRTYTVSVSMAQPQLALYQLTSPNKADSTPDGDIRDSDGILVGGTAYVSFQTGIPRQNNHSFDFGFNNAVSLGNQVWYDVNNNGIFDAGETGVTGAAVELHIDSNGNGQYDAADALISSTVTVNGLYNFVNLSPTSSINTNYLVVLPASNFCAGGVLQHYQNSTGSVGGNSDLNLRDHGIDPVGAGGLTCAAPSVIASGPVSLTVGGEPITDGDADPNSNLTLDFGFYKLELGNYVWLDQDNSGNLNGTEPGLPNVPVRLLDAANTVLSSTVTNASGFYTFTNLVSGTYCAEITLPPGYTSSTGPSESGTPDTNIDSDDNGTITAGVGISVVRSNCLVLTPGAEPIVITATATTQNPTLDFGVQTWAAVGNYVWLDVNQDGRQDSAASAVEPPMPGITVTLLNTANVVLTTTTTNLAGSYLFTALLPGSYYVCFDAPFGYTFTTPLVGSVITSDLDSNANPIDNTGMAGRACSSVVTLQPGEFNPTLDAGLVTPTLPAGLGNYVWIDLNHNGRQDGTEPPTPGVTVTLYGSANLPITQTRTDVAGGYIFTSLIAGSYYVCFDTPTGYTFTVWMSGTNMLSDVDSNANPGLPGPGLPGPISNTGVPGRACSPPVTLQPGEFNPTLDAGVVQIPASIGNYVWLDLNQDGRQDSTEPPVPGITVTLYNSASVAISTITTGPTGGYIFTALVPSTYYVCFSTPSGYTYTTWMVGGVITSDLDSNADRSTGCSMVVELRPGEINPSLDAGLVTPTILSGLGNYVWVDDNKDGLQQPAELPVQGLTVTLFGSANLPISTTRTTVAGGYSFTGLIPSAYYVCFASPVAYTFTYWMSGTNMTSDRDSNANINDGHGIPNLACSMSVTLQPGEYNPTLDAGIYRFTVNAVSLSGFSTQQSGNFVEVSWTTGTEINSFGFALYRSTDNSRANATLVTAEMIAARGPSTYRFVDRTADPSQRYTYWLVEMETDGKLNEYAPTTYAPASTPGVAVNGATADVAINVGGVPVVIAPIAAPNAGPQDNFSAPPINNPQREVAVQADPAALTQASAQPLPQPVANVQSEGQQTQPQAMPAAQASAPQAQAEPASQPATAQTQPAPQQPAAENQPLAASNQQPSTDNTQATANKPAPVAGQQPPASSPIWLAVRLALVGFLAAGVLLSIGLLAWAVARRR